MSVILVHGSVETSCEQPYINSLKRAALAGSRALSKNLLDGVETAVMLLEDDPLFNAGCGSVLNLEGEVEMDASFMDGSSGKCGAVAAIQEVKNPVCVARKVMAETPHVLLAGKGATKFARQKGFLYFNPVTDIQRTSWEKAVKALKKGEPLDYSAFTGLPRSCDTVGCIAVHNGRTAAASSTGGSFLKYPGRVGDTPVIGGGIYASTHGAAVCTGLGESFIRLQSAAWTLNLISQGVNVQDAARAAVRQLVKLGTPGGILVLDAAGNAAAVHNTCSFPIAMAVDGKLVEDFKPEVITSSI